jgi:hypothetical protein
MSTQKDIIGAMKQQTSGPSRRELIASGVATAGLALTTPAFGASLTPKRDVCGRDFAMTGIRRFQPAAVRKRGQNLRSLRLVQPNTSKIFA